MKLLHLGDLHLGRSIKGFDLYDDQKYILDQIITYSIEKHIDAIILAGDIYDKKDPNEGAVRLLDSFLNKLSENNIKVYGISGNHDSAERLNYGTSLFASRGIFIYAKFDGSLHKYQLQVGEGKKAVNLYLLPFSGFRTIQSFYPDEKIDSYDDAIRVVVEKAQIDPGQTNILVAHQFVGGRSFVPETAGSEMNSVKLDAQRISAAIEKNDINVGTVSIIGYDLFDAFDYVALGHIHSPQKVGREEIRYAGSLLKYSLSEVDNNKSFPVLEIDEEGHLSFEIVPLKPRREMRHIVGSIKQLLSSENVTNSDDYIYATVTDDTITENLMNLFQKYYPNTLQVDVKNSHSQRALMPDIDDIAEGKTFEELVSEFYSWRYDKEISEEELKILKEVAKEAGIDDETN